MSSSLDLLSSKSQIVPCYVDGKLFHGSSQYEVLDPHDNSKVLHQVSSITVDDVPKILETSARAFKTWKKTPVTERRNIFLKAAALLKERQGDYAAVEVAETTSGPGWAGFEVFMGIDSIEEAAASATLALRGEIATTEAGKRAYISRCPYGVVFAMAPWNAPFVLSQRAALNPVSFHVCIFVTSRHCITSLGIKFLLTAFVSCLSSCDQIIGGNTCILKTSEMSPKTQLTLAQLMHDAGLPAGVLNVVHVAPKDAPAVCEAIIAYDAVGKINFTGSTRVGSIIASIAGKHIKPLVLELGGKAPAIVCHDADLSNACQAIAFGGWMNSGQVCMATQTVIAHESIAEKLVGLLNEHVKNVSAAGEGAPLRGLFTQASAERAKGIVDDALGKGAKVAAGEWKVEDNLVQPILLQGVTPKMQIYKTEMFAPIFSIVTFKDEEEAIRIANDHEYGLSASVFTTDVARGMKLAEEIDSGAVHINGASVSTIVVPDSGPSEAVRGATPIADGFGLVWQVHDSAAHPHGGWKKSGYGRFNGIEGIREFMQFKTITVNEPHPYPGFLFM
ncbi:BZ3500_MvSof-1268-A1-R1_Chr2-3g05400 [Microbotryum saponariae]|uniref:BZ3500_MvSof-1268-A1-R1_Chr2-3g05400 protein n=1 Tax=Microbotryum saponariae TaxID=289078 RepID=A0A2X0K597_9BASI|nr:BZ3500_MvSof-1268-A1-R1_Chr2-3g05400 [Microbotryum saponariae]SDA01364.1 BZ3501_MvSof-1269-A2-R1_Chr2-2g05073 [Microbotryum saponariae]